MMTIIMMVLWFGTSERGAYPYETKECSKCGWFYTQRDIANAEALYEAGVDFSNRCCKCGREHR